MRTVIYNNTVGTNEPANLMKLREQFFKQIALRDAGDAPVRGLPPSPHALVFSDSIS